MTLNRLFLLPALCSLLCLNAQAAETLVSIPPGTYSLSQIAPNSGTPPQWIRYKPQTPGSVIVRGGDLSGVQYVILDGFMINANLNLSGKYLGLSVGTSNVRVENNEIIGFHDVHEGYDKDGNWDCHEGGAAKGGGLSVEAAAENVTLYNNVVHGFYDAGVIHGRSVRLENNLFRNNFNGLSISGDNVDLIGNVFWVHPNHLFTLEGAGSLRFFNNLMVDSQDGVQAGFNWNGANDLQFIHNTYYTGPNTPCNGGGGINATNIRHRLVVKNNSFFTQSGIFQGIKDRLIPGTLSDYNLTYGYNTQAGEDYNMYDLIGQTYKGVFYDQGKVPAGVWIERTGQDTHTLLRQKPLYTDAPDFLNPRPTIGSDANQWGFRNPTSVAQARAWFKLLSGSPGKSSASDGLDRGIVDGLTIPPAFDPGTRVETIRQTAVLASAGGTTSGTQAINSLGSISGGPTTVNGITYWNVNFDNSPDGWVAESSIKKYFPRLPLAAAITSVRGNNGPAPFSTEVRAVVYGTIEGDILNYTFYCNRSDPGVNITQPHDLRVTNSPLYLGYTTTGSFCTYSANGTYTLKVIIERGSEAAEDRYVITVNSTGEPPPPSSLPQPTLSLPSHLPVNATLIAGYPAGYSNITFRWTINRATAPGLHTAGRPASGVAGSGIGAPSTQPAALSPARTQSATFTSGATASLASYALDPGYYSVSVRAVDASGKTSTAATGYVTLVGAEFSGVHVFPNPWRADKHSNKNVVFAGLPSGSTVKIFTVSGHHVKTLTPVLTTATWDLTNGQGVKVASGIYVYVIKVGENSGTESGKATGQVMVIR